MSAIKIAFTTTDLEIAGADPGQQNIRVEAYNNFHPVVLSIGSDTGKVRCPLTQADAYTLIDALKLVLSRHVAEATDTANLARKPR